jgi:hypothetical protein
MGSHFDVGLNSAYLGPTLRGDLQRFRSDECGIIFCKGSEGR